MNEDVTLVKSVASTQATVDTKNMINKMETKDDSQKIVDNECGINPNKGEEMEKTEGGETDVNVNEVEEDSSRKEKEVVEETEGTDDADSKTLSHTELKKVFEGALSQLLQGDPILSDLHPQVTLEEVWSDLF